MGKMSELEAVITDLRKAAETINTAADTLFEMFGGKQYSMPEVRALLSRKSCGGENGNNTAAVKALLLKYGSDRLSGIDPSKYGALVADAQELPDPKVEGKNDDT